jgi:hypothetical protein
LQRHEINEAGYLAGRAALATPIDDRGDLRRLVTANETVHETRTRLDVGRGNVTADVVGSRASSTYRTVTAYMATELEGLGSVEGLGDVSRFERRDATALALHAGNCDQNGWIAARMHGSRLEAGETTHVVNSHAAQHTWAELRTPGRPSVTLDPWANGPAMQADDTKLGGLERKPEASFDMETGPVARDRLLQLAEAYAQGDAAAVLAKQLHHYETTQPRLNATLWSHSMQLADGTPETSQPGFGETARERMAQHPPLLQQVLAVGAARSAYHMTIPAAAHQADAIVGAARTLHTMPNGLARPPLRHPDTLT